MTKSSVPSTKTAWRMWGHQPFKTLGFSVGEKKAELLVVFASETKQALFAAFKAIEGKAFT